MVFDWFRRQFSQAGKEAPTPDPAVEPSAGEEAGAVPESASDSATPANLAEASEPEPAQEPATEPLGATSPEQAVSPQPAASATSSSEPEQRVEPPVAPPAVNEDYLAWARAAFQNIKRQQEQPEPSPVSDGSEAPPAELQPSDSAVDAAAPTVPETVPVEGQNSEPLSPDAVVAPPTPEEPVAAAAPEPISFLERAEAERQARLEQLKTEAFEEPQPEPEPQPAAQPLDLPGIPSTPGLTFDENFLWSAEVLAAQGRRPEEISAEEIDWLTNLRRGLDKTRRGLLNQLKSVVGQGPLNADAVDEVESLLLQADVGVEAADWIIGKLQAKLRDEALPAEGAIAYLKLLLRELLDQPLLGQEQMVLAPEKGQLNVWLLAGVNGAGKTTTIGKLAHLATKSGYRTLIAAADTFRAAAVEQVKIWGERSGVDVIANPGQNTDPAAVVFDAISAAQSRGSELLLIDTAGRLQNKNNLMAELSKVRRIIDRQAPEAKIESLLVLDATQGQNGLRQAQVFSEAANLTGVVLTKLDGTAKGGIALAIVQQLGLPIRFVGAGERLADLRPFSSYEFVEALLNG
jgi:fused signal recognition particle receptor